MNKCNTFKQNFFYYLRALFTQIKTLKYFFYKPRFNA